MLWSAFTHLLHAGRSIALEGVHRKYCIGQWCCDEEKLVQDGGFEFLDLMSSYTNSETGDNCYSGSKTHSVFGKRF
jgi:hypothetical protein